LGKIVILRFHSPLPPERTGVADYSATLLPELERLAQVIVNPTGPTPGLDLYHIGNNGFHYNAYQQALARPGVVVLHDAVLQHFFLGHLSREAYLEEFLHNYGEWYRPFAGQLWEDRNKASSDARFFEWPLLRRLAERSLGLIVHNAAAEQAVRRHAPKAKVIVIPHLFTPPPEPDPLDVAALRAQWTASAPVGVTVIGIFGYLRETKRIPAIFNAFERARMRGAKLALLVAGEFLSKGLEDSLRTRLAQPGVIRRGFVEEDEFWLQAHAVDACVNLRVPSAGESSGIAARLMGIGKAVFLTEGAEVAHFPAGSYFPVSAGREEEAELEALFLLIARHPELTREMGRLARAHVEREQAVDRVAAEYVKFARQFA
jgi:glycosyltransferase involved in cell wall biosynthesis